MTSAYKPAPAVPAQRRNRPAFGAAGACRFAASIVTFLAETALAAAPGQSGWILEHFGQDVSILRTHRGPQDAASTGRLFLSCDGQSQRLTLELPDRHAGGGGVAPTGFLLLRPSGAADGPYVVMRYTAQDARTLVVRANADPTRGSGIGELIRLLTARPPTLDVLVRDLRNATLGRFDSFVLPLRFGDGAIEAINGFAIGCRQIDGQSGKASR